MLNNIIELFYKETLVTIGYVIFLSIIVPYLKYISKYTKLFGLLGIFFNTKKLIRHDVFNKLKNLPSFNVTVHINLTGRKLVFTDLFIFEAAFVSNILFDYISGLTYYKDSKIKQLFLMLKKINRFTNINVANDLLELFDSYKQSLPNLLLWSIYPYIKCPEEIKNKNEYQKEKAQVIINIYEEVMLVYRNQLICNILQHINSDKNLYELLIDVLNTSIIPVYVNIRDTVDMNINRVNGSLEGIIYKSFKLYD